MTLKQSNIWQKKKIEQHKPVYNQDSVYSFWLLLLLHIFISNSYDNNLTSIVALLYGFFLSRSDSHSPVQYTWLVCFVLFSSRVFEILAHDPESRTKTQQTSRYITCWLTGIKIKMEILWWLTRGGRWECIETFCIQIIQESYSKNKISVDEEMKWRIKAIFG